VEVFINENRLATDEELRLVKHIHSDSASEDDDTADDENDDNNVDDQ
jgi:hypothetical protein